jgi:tetratricopeptide (TPR) repeat protein
MKSLKFALCTVLFITSNVEAVDAPKGWNDWMSEGENLRSAGKYLAAVPAFQRALAIAEASERTDTKLIQALDSLAAAYAEAGQVANAEGEYRRALASLEAVQQQKSLVYAVLLASLASISDEIGNSEETIAELRRAISVYGQVSGSTNLFTVRECLAEILIQRKEYDEAGRLLLDARDDLAKQRAVDPARLCTALNNLGQIRYLQGRFDEAAALYLQSTTTLRASLGDEHPTIAPALNNLAMDYFQMGRFDDADKIFQQAATLCNRALGSHPTCGEIYKNYAIALEKMGRKHEAKKLRAESRQILEAFRRSNGIGSTVSVTALRFDKN